MGGPRACETAAASEPVAAASWHQESRLFARLGAIVSLRSCQRGQARSGQDWRGAGNIGRTMLRAAGAWTSSPLVPGASSLKNAKLASSASLDRRLRPMERSSSSNRLMRLRTPGRPQAKACGHRFRFFFAIRSPKPPVSSSSMN